MIPDSDFEDLVAEFPELAHGNIVWEKEVYAHFGLTFSAFGTLEHGLANILAVRLTSAEARPSRQKFDHHLGSCFQRTLGNLITELERFYAGHEFITKLRAAKAKRDYLAHHFFREKAVDLFSKEGMQSLLLELNGIRQEIERLVSVTDGLVDEQLALLGWNAADFRQSVELQTQSLIRQARHRDE